MTFRVPLIASVAIVACMFAVSLWAWPVIPDTARIAVHWDAAGNPNGYAAKSSALLFLPLFAAIMAIVLAMPPLLLPKRLGATESRSIYPLVWLGALCLLALAHCATVAAALGIRFNASVAALAGIALFFAAIGLTLRRVLPPASIRSRMLAANRVPREIDRMAGNVFAAAGFTTLATLAVAGLPAAFRIFVGGTIASSLILVVQPVIWLFGFEQRGSKK